MGLSWLSSTAWACRREAPPSSAGLRPTPPMASWPFGLIPHAASLPAALCASLASGGGQRPAAMGRAWRIRRGLLRQVAGMCALPDAGGSLPGRHERRFTQVHGEGRPAWRGHPHRAASKAAAGNAGAHCPVVVGGGLARVRGACRCSLRAGMPSRPRLLGGAGRPKASCLYVNPGDGRASMAATFQPK